MSKNLTAAIFIVLCAFPFSFVYAGFDPAVRPNLRTDRFIQRMEARYGLLPAGYLNQPVGTTSLLLYLDSVSQKPLSASERRELLNLSKQLSVDKGIYGFYDEQSETGFIINLDLTGETWARGGGDTRGGGRGIISPMLRGHIGKLSFYSGLDVWTEYVYDSLFTQTSWQPYDGNPYTFYGRGKESADMRASDVPRAGVSYRAGKINLQAGLDYLRMGPAVHYPLTLSGRAPPITYFRTVFDLSHFEYSHLAGFLRSEKDKAKYIYSNRLSGNFFGNAFKWGISEVVIDGEPTNQQDGDTLYNRRRAGLEEEKHGWEWVYCIPFVPMVFVEHYAGDKSNSALSFDASLNWPQNFRFYGEFFMDDMLSPWKILSDDWGNKWALTTGAQYFSAIYNRDISVGIEYSRVEPWVYTHIYGGSHRYDHFNVNLGSPMGPNSRAIAVNADMSVTKKTTVGLSLKSLAENTEARGGKITDIFQEAGNPDVTNPDSETKTFLGSGSVHRLRPGVYGYYDPLGAFWLSVSAEIDADSDRGDIHLQIDGGFRF